MEDSLDKIMTDDLSNSALIESSLLGVAMRDEEARDVVSNQLTRQHFSSSERGDLFLAIQEMNERGMVVDVITIAEYMSFGGEVNTPGTDIDFIGKVARSSGAPENVETYISLLNNTYTSKKLSTIGHKIADISLGKGSAPEKMEAAEALLSSLAIDTSKGPVRAYDVVGKLIDNIEKRVDSDGALTGLSTGIDDLDELTNGLQDNDLIIIAGRPSQGKTSLAENISTHNAAKGKKTAFFSIEMGEEQVVERMFASYSSVDLSRLKKGNLDDSEWQKLTLFISKIKKWDAFIDETGDISIGEIIARSRALHRKGGLDLIVIDYLQLVTGGGGATESARIGNITRRLKMLAKELGVPVILLSQLSRNLESRQDKRPIMSDLRDSGAIEQDADVILFVYRDEYYNPDSTAKGMAELLIKKHRNGSIGEVFTRFEGKHCRFKNLQTGYEDYDYGQEGNNWHAES